MSRFLSGVCAARDAGAESADLTELQGSALLRTERSVRRSAER